jgi:hypothetical protein
MSSRGWVCAVSAIILSCSAIFLSGCSGLVSGASTTPSTLNIANIQAASITTSSSQVVWATNVPANSSVDYGTTPAYGNSTPVDSGMVTSHQMTLSALAAGTTYYFQVNSTDSKGNHGHGGNKFTTAGFSMSGTINPTSAGNGASVTLSGAASASATADSSGNYTFTGLPNGSYMVTPKHTGYAFTPGNQSATVNGANVTGVNFTATLQTFSISGTISPSAGGSGATVTLSGAGNATATANSSGAYTLTGLTSGSYTITPSNAGYTFTPLSQNVTVSTADVSGVNFTDNAVAVAPTITTQPANQTVTAGRTATFAVVAAGTAPLSYQWQKNGANVAGATSSSYTTPVTTTADSGSTFAVVVSNTAGTVTSNAATLMVNPAAVAPTITTPPANQTVTAGQTATFTVVAAGTAPLSYQWQKNGANIAGATSTSYTTPVTTTSDSGSTFAVVVTNTAGTVTSAAAAMTVNPAPAPAIQVSPINFGNDVVGTNLSQPMIIKNTGTATLTITQVTETGSAFFTVSGFSLPLNVNAGQQTTITVVFLPTSVGPASGNISITSNAPTSPTSVALAGTGIAATLTLNISPTSLSFGNVTTGTSSATQNVTITSTGNSNVTISQINLVGAGYTMTGGGTPVTLSPTQSITLVVQFSPTTAGIVPGSITVVSNATGSPATITLSATGVAPIQHSVALTWDASTSTVSGYNVYRSTASGTGYAKINTSLVTGLTFADSTVQSATSYFYVTTAVDSSGKESVYSNEVTAPIP